MPDGSLCLAMEYAENGDLVKYVRTMQAAGRWSTDMALSLITDMARGLAYVHRKGVLHRDIKPANVLVNDKGSALLADFGLSKNVGPAAVGKKLEYISGTALYLSPESYHAAITSTPMSVEVAAACDIWALACTFHGLLLGFPEWPAGTTPPEVSCEVQWVPFFVPGDTGTAAGTTALIARIQGAIVDMSRLPADAPPKLVELMKRMLATDPAGRPTADMVLADLVTSCKRRLSAAAVPVTESLLRHT